MVDYSTQKISPELVNELKIALKSIKGYGSVEIYIQDNTVTQITIRNIKKTNGIKLNSKS
ncbi:hypothetical protein A2691_00605 [Candidatus Woesebacteria bacterium RIFCSPHIGHO2_01_FULL_39_23]|nr:MAG: hypothetical protein A2691_00605 [Candidatus Woesebacteria bacterium RIFCSPHIGHO2_01_FULL_39_23]